MAAQADIVLALAFATVAHVAAAQHVATTERRTQVAGAVTVTNNGISLLPAPTSAPR
jgi:hypothetical protein